MKIFTVLFLGYSVLILLISVVKSSPCDQDAKCTLPACFCATTKHFLGSKDIPQIVYFAIDDEVNEQVSQYYTRLFHPTRRNPNGSPISATLMIDNHNTNYTTLQYFYDNGFEIGLHSTKTAKDKRELMDEIKLQREIIVNNTQIPIGKLHGWRSPYLKTLGNDQMNALKDLGLQYDISKTFVRAKTSVNPFPFTTDYPWPYNCNILPCWNESISGLWEVPINSMWDYLDQYPCVYTDGCHNAPPTEEDFFEYMMANFNNSYNKNRAPLGIHVHGRYFQSVNYYRGMDRFIEHILNYYTDVYIIPVSKMLSWMKTPVKIQQIRGFIPWIGRINHPLPEMPALPPPITTPLPTTPPTTTPEPVLPDPANCIQGDTCRLPQCFCKTFNHYLPKQNIPQIVYFAIDDGMSSQNYAYYQDLFDKSKKNPNNCPITASFYVTDYGTDYSLVEGMYKLGMEIAAHGVSHQKIETAKDLVNATQTQKQNIANKANIPINEIVGWRSPYLQTIGDTQVNILRKQGYTYDISYTYTRRPNSSSNVWPMTADYAWYKLDCNIPPCLKKVHKGFWEVPINSMWDYTYENICTYTDSCVRQPPTQQHVFKYLVDNFENSYNKNEANRAPFGIHLHGRWFNDQKHFDGMKRFIDYLLARPNNDVYIVSVKQMLEWMKNPTELDNIKTFAPWSCTQQQNVMGLKVTFPLSETTTEGFIPIP